MGSRARPGARRRTVVGVKETAAGSSRERVRVRDLAARDLKAILVIEAASFQDPWSAESFRSMLAQSQTLATVVERSGAVAGYCVAWMVGDEAELTNLAVEPGLRRTGLGRALLDQLLDTIAARGGATLYLEVRESNAAAQALYRSRGFEVTGRRKSYYSGPTEDALIMRRARDRAESAPA